MNIIVQFKQNDFVLFVIIDAENTVWIESRNEMEFFQYVADSSSKTSLVKIIGNEKEKILKILENDANVKLCMQRKYPIETPQMSKNLKYYNVFKIQSKAKMTNMDFGILFIKN